MSRHPLIGKYKGLLCLIFIGLLSSPFAQAKNKLTQITTLGIAEKTAKHIFKYADIKLIGVCLWWKMSWLGPKLYITPELDEYLPDLVVSVYNRPGDNPFLEAGLLLDKASRPLASSAIKAATGFSLGEGATNTHHSAANLGLKTKYVDIIGHPLTLIDIPFLTLKPDTKAFVPYYQSSLDILGDRLGVAEMLRPETYNPFSHFIGTGIINHWSHEFPRSMTVNVNNDYKASVIAALRAADLVTNKHWLHVAHGTNNSCGKSCAVANVIEELDEKHAKWQEVYPNNRHIHPGVSDSTNIASLGSDDEEKGHGRYVFVIWRRYRGCIQGKHFITAQKKIRPTQKR